MALQSSGQLIRMSQINTELGRSSTATISLDTAENGGYGTINTCASPYPLAANPASMSEWYGYNHSAACGNSSYAMSDGGTATSQGMLYSDSISYSGTVSTSRPSPVSEFTISFWLKRATGDSSVGYLFGLDGGTTNDSLIMYWDSTEDPNDPGVYANRIVLSFNDDGGGSMQSVVNLSDTNNSTPTGVSPTFWDNNNQGNVEPHGYSLITVVIYYPAWATNDYIKWYWNDVQLDVPWNAGAVGFQDSYTVGDSITTPDWTNSVLYIGGSVPTELSSGCQLDSYAVYPATRLLGSDVSTLYNGGSVATLTDYQNIGALLYYNFESASPSIGEDTGATYGMFLDEFSTPIRIADPAV
jgi:hypothetical protein